MFKVKKISDKPARTDGTRVFVERTWPKGLKKEETRVDMHMKDIAPSQELRRWFNNTPERWDEFKQRYLEELRDKHEQIHTLMEKDRQGTVTLLHNSREDRFNEAEALKECLEMRGGHTHERREEQQFAGAVL